MLYNSAADSFYIMKLCSRLFVLHCRSRPKYGNSVYFDPHFEEVSGGVEPWWMARWIDGYLESPFPTACFLYLQEGQHPLTGQRAPPISGGTNRRRRTLIDGYLESPFPIACFL